MPRGDGQGAGEAGGESIQAVAIALQILEHLAVQHTDTGVTALAAALGG